jgi:hypothetical protein
MDCCQLAGLKGVCHWTKCSEYKGGFHVEIDAFREKGHERQDQVKPDWDQKRADLQAKREAACAKLAEVKQSSAEAWKEIQQGAQSAWETLEQAFQDASSKF